MTRSNLVCNYLTLKGVNLTKTQHNQIQKAVHKLEKGKASALCIALRIQRIAGLFDSQPQLIDILSQEMKDGAA